jgi:hypothetical protein
MAELALSTLPLTTSEPQGWPFIQQIIDDAAPMLARINIAITVVDSRIPPAVAAILADIAIASEESNGWRKRHPQYKIL